MKYSPSVHPSLPPPVLPDTLEKAHQVILENHALTVKLFSLVEALQAEIVELRERQDKHSNNSSKPPSQDSPEQRSKRHGKPPTGKQKGGQLGHNKHQRALVDVDQVDEVKHYYPDTTCTCGGEYILEAAPSRRHQVFDLPEVRHTVTEHQSYAGVCARCGVRQVARLPNWVPAGQLGSGLMGWLGLMNGKYRLSVRNLQALLEEQWGLSFSLGAISEAQGQLTNWLKPVYEQIGKEVRSAPVAHADETTHYRYSAQSRRLEHHWLWTLTAGSAVYLMPHFSRGKLAADSLLGNFNGVLVTDRYGGYNGYPVEKRQVCLAHVIRNLTEMEQRAGRAGVLGNQLVRLLRLVVRTEHFYKNGLYPLRTRERRLNQLQAAFHARLNEGSDWWPCHRTRNQCLKLLKDEPMLWTFRRYPDVPLTNNAAERSIRPYVIWRKTSFFSQSRRGDRFRAYLLSVIETCKRLGAPAYDFLRQICLQGARGDPITLGFDFASQST
jgi:transposase